MKIIVTAGATREYIDPVRFISNPSTGKMGFFLAETAKKRGHDVVLIIGHCAVDIPKEMPLVMAGSAHEMRKAVMKYTDWADVLIMTAAVGDWRVQKTNKKKIKKPVKKLSLKLIQNPDILSGIGRLKKQGKNKRIFLTGFSVDTESLTDNAAQKLKVKNLDLIVANSHETFGQAGIEAVVLDKAGVVSKFPLMSKKQFAKKLIGIIEKHAVKQ